MEAEGIEIPTTPSTAAVFMEKRHSTINTVAAVAIWLGAIHLNVVIVVSFSLFLSLPKAFAYVFLSTSYD